MAVEHAFGTGIRDPSVPGTLEEKYDKFEVSLTIPVCAHASVCVCGWVHACVHAWVGACVLECVCVCAHVCGPAR